MPRTKYSISRADGLRKSAKRGIVFLEGDEHCSGKMAFDALSERISRDLKGRFDYWIDGFVEDKYFHGWPNLEDYKLCFSFRWREGKVRNRIYGFLCNPKPLDPRFRMCVLVTYASKAEETDFTILDHINKLRKSADVLAAIQICIATEDKP